MAKWTNTTPNYLMVDVVMENKSAQSYDQEMFGLSFTFLKATTMTYQLKMFGTNYIV